MRIRFEISGRLPGANEFINASYSSRWRGNKLKKESQARIREAIEEAGITRFDSPVAISIEYFEPNSRRDVDNIAFAKKFILDAMVQCGVIEDDSQKYVKGFAGETFLVDKENPRVVVEVTDEL